MTRLIDHATKKRVFNAVMSDSKPDAYFFIMVLLSCTVATYGLLSNSTAVVIGAMLIAPLMGPILAGALAMATNSRDLLKTALKAELMGSATAVVLSVLLTLILPQSDLTTEIIARTTPTILDLVIALASGAAGTYAIIKKPQGATLPGVAIATALMPPLCVIGIGIAKQNFAVAGGALLLFLANMIAINVAAIGLFELVGFTAEKDSDSEADSHARTRNRMIYPALMLLMISIPLALIMLKTYGQANLDRIVKNALTESLDVIAPHSTLISVSFKESDNRVIVDAALRTTKIINPENVRQMENLLELRTGKPTIVNADVVLIQKVDNQNRVDTFQDLLPKVTQSQVVQVEKTTTPEEIIGTVLREKLMLFKGFELKDFSLEYRDSTGTYAVTVLLRGNGTVGNAFGDVVRGILEDRLKRRVSIHVEIETPIGTGSGLPSNQ